MGVRVLSFHGRYACRDSGVCCSSAWPIPIEYDRLIPLRDALAGGLLEPASGNRDAAVVFSPQAPPDTPALLGVAAGHCAFFDRDEPRHCRVQHALGHAALPLACRQFPRVTVRTPLATSVTLSHYCPTAADLLGSQEPVAIVTDAPSFPAGGEYVGLDARDTLPPLLRPDVLMDWHAWQALEARSVDLLCNDAHTAEEGLGRLHTVVEHLRLWRPGSASLMSAIDDAFDRARRETSLYRTHVERRVAEVLSDNEVGTRFLENGFRPRCCTPPAIARRFLAAHAFASWTAYLGQGIRTWFRGIEAAYALLEAGYGPAGADLLLRHLADTRTLTEVWNEADN